MDGVGAVGGLLAIQSVRSVSSDDRQPCIHYWNSNQHCLTASFPKHSRNSFQTPHIHTWLKDLVLQRIPELIHELAHLAIAAYIQNLYVASLCTSDDRLPRQTLAICLQIDAQ